MSGRRLQSGGAAALPLAIASLMAASLSATQFNGEVVDQDTSESLAARVYIQAGSGEWLFVDSMASDGSALPYKEQWVPMPGSVERHTTVSAHPFKTDLAPGRYDITIERGKEYLPLSIVIGADRASHVFRLKRWINMAGRGWHSGETHVHRRIRELPNVMLAEDLNIAFPVTFWTTSAYAAPDLKPSTLRRQGPSPFGDREDRGTKPIFIDDTHVMFPRNTEYEIFSVDGKRHTQGAVFILNHKTAFQAGMPPVAKIAELAHREGALLDLDKHSWPWAMMLVPIAKVDLYELSNNSVWRTQFGFRGAAVQPPDYMKLEREGNGFTEWGWLNFGFENYYTLLNCGFRLTPTAGTASGVHPVPLGHSRVYVHTGEKFTPDAWLNGLREGRSFVTTGPMLFATVNRKLPGEVFKQSRRNDATYEVSIESVSDRPIRRIEILVNGRIVATPAARNERTNAGAFVTKAKVRIPVSETSWIAVRSIQPMPDGRRRFAHTAPWHIEVDGEPIRPRKEEIDFLIRRVTDEIKRNEGVLKEDALEEFREALGVYQKIAKRAW
jgi:hypothetical protein